MGQAAEVYAEELSSLRFGHPLWFPEEEVHIGDVGFVDDGRFRRLFNVTTPSNHPWNSGGVPDHFEPFAVPARLRSGDSHYLEPGPYTSQTVHRLEVDPELSFNAGGLGQTTISYKFQCSNHQGALLSLDNPAESQNINRSSKFRNFIARNHRTWYDYVTTELDIDCKPEELICISGWVKTSQWTVAAFTKEASSHDCTIQGHIGPVAGAGLGLHITNSRHMTPIQRSGPKCARNPSRLPSTWASEGMASAGNDQTIFIQFYQVKYRRFLVPKALRAAAGPDRLPDADKEDGDSFLVTVEREGMGDSNPPHAFSSENKFKSALDPLLDYLLEHNTADMAIASHGDLYSLEEDIASSSTQQQMLTEYHEQPSYDSTRAPTRSEVDSSTPYMSPAILSSENSPTFASHDYLASEDIPDNFEFRSLSPEYPGHLVERDRSLMGRRNPPQRPLMDPQIPRSSHRVQDYQRGPLGSSSRAGHRETPDLQDSRQGVQDSGQQQRHFPALAKKSGLLIGINYDRRRNEPNDCNEGVRMFRQHLISRWGYASSDITVLIEDADDPTRLPTKQNILDEIRQLVSNARSRDHVLFYFAGHSYQAKHHLDVEIDGMDEAIFPLDHEVAGCITDQELREALIHPLPPDCHLEMIFDTCHSGTLLDLPGTHSREGYINRNELALRRRTDPSSSNSLGEPPSSAFSFTPGTRADFVDTCWPPAHIHSVDNQSTSMRSWSRYREDRAQDEPDPRPNIPPVPGSMCSTLITASNRNAPQSYGQLLNAFDGQRLHLYSSRSLDLSAPFRF